MVGWTTTDTRAFWRNAPIIISHTREHSILKCWINLGVCCKGARKGVYLRGNSWVYTRPPVSPASPHLSLMRTFGLINNKAWKQVIVSGGPVPIKVHPDSRELPSFRHTCVGTVTPQPVVPRTGVRCERPAVEISLTLSCLKISINDKCCLHLYFFCK